MTAVRALLGILLFAVLVPEIAVGGTSINKQSCQNKHRSNSSSVITRSYPICFFNEVPKGVEREELKKSFETFLRPYMSARPYEIGFSSDLRWMSLKGRLLGHVSLMKVWPRIGCSGSYSTEYEYISYRRCVMYLRQFMKQSNYEYMGHLSDGDGISGQLFCSGR